MGHTHPGSPDADYPGVPCEEHDWCPNHCEGCWADSDEYDGCEGKLECITGFFQSIDNNYQKYLMDHLVVKYIGSHYEDGEYENQYLVYELIVDGDKAEVRKCLRGDNHNRVELILDGAIYFVGTPWEFQCEYPDITWELPKYWRR